jgi:RNA polymerase sigma-70 factor, ECF subfamily
MVSEHMNEQKPIELRCSGPLVTGAAIPQEIATLYERYAPMVLHTAYLILDSWEQADDVAQEVWLIVTRNYDNYRAERGSWSTWIYRITVNHALNMQRRLVAWLRRETALSASERARHPAPLEALIQNEERLALWGAIRHLPIKLRVVIVLRYYHNLSYEQISSVLECPIGTVRSRLNAAHSRLRGMLEGPR